ncbi:MAG: radical SAM protein [Theionarchaea archaeon]|nr:radical SAM protein [Theionarchaea archaeon]
MKVSHYNIFFPFNEEYVLFNTLEGSIFMVDSETKDLLEKNEISSLNKEQIRAFVDNGIIVEDKLNEQNAYRILYERSKYTTSLTDVEVVTTYECNLACIYCYEGKGELEHKRMDEKTVKCVIEFVQRLAKNNHSSTLRADLFGGEPFLNMPVNLILAKELSKWCEENNKSFLMSAFTNGTLSTEKVVEDLAQYNCEFVVVIDGPKEIHDQRRVYKNGKGTFDNIIDGLRRITDYGLGIGIRINVDKTNKEHVVPFFEFLKEEGLTDVSLSIKPVFNTSPACSSYRYCMSDIEELLVIKHLNNIARSMNFTTGNLEGLSPLGVCDAQKLLHFVIDPYLRLFKCNIQLPFEKNVVGIINPENSEPTFNYVNVDFMSRDPLAINRCRMCKLAPICRGGCLAEIYETQGDAHGYVCRKECTYEALQEDLRNFVRKNMQ